MCAEWLLKENVLQGFNMLLRNWIDEKLLEIASKLPTLVHTDPASFACGHNMGYKQALLDLDNLIEYDPQLSIVLCDHEFKKTLADSGMYFINYCDKCKDTEPYWGIEGSYD